MLIKKAGYSFFISAFGMLYGLIFIQSASTLAANELAWWSCGFGVLLVSRGLGTVWGRSQAARPEGKKVFIPLAIGLAVSGASAGIFVPLAYIVSFYVGQTAGLFGGLGLFALFFVLGLSGIGFLSGAAGPFVSRRGEEGSIAGSCSSGVMAAHYAGLLPAGWLFSSVIVPGEELLPVALWVGVLNLGLIALMVWDSGAGAARKKRFSAVLVTLVCILLVILQRQQPLQQYLAKKKYFTFLKQTAADIFRVDRSWPDIAHYRSPYGGIDVFGFIPNPLDIWLYRAYSRKYIDAPDYPWGYMLLFNHERQLNSQWDEFYQEYFVHIPVVLQGRVPRNVLVVGRGGKLLVKELLKYRDVAHVTVVGADPVFLALARQDPVWDHMSGRFQRDRRVEIVDRDAFDFLRDDRRRYDAVYMDFPPPSGYEQSRFYSEEFFRLVGERMTPDGFSVLDADKIDALRETGPDGSLLPVPENPWPVYSSTLRAAGFKTIVPYAISLEPDNAAAVEAVGAVLYGRKYYLSEDCDPRGSSCLTDPAKTARAQERVAAFSRSVTQGFIFLRKDIRALGQDFLPQEINPAVLTPQRLNRALRLSRLLPFSFRKDQVHSLLRPVFPGRSAQTLFPLPESRPE